MLNAIKPVGCDAFQLLKFVAPPLYQTESTSTSTEHGVTYSEVATGVDPTYAALRLLTNGALGTVLYSQVATNAIASITGNLTCTKSRHHLLLSSCDCNHTSIKTDTSWSDLEQKTQNILLAETQLR